VTEQLNQFPPGQRKEFARTVLASGFPASETLEEFRTLVAAPILHGPPQPHTAVHITRTQRTRPKRPLIYARYRDRHSGYQIHLRGQPVRLVIGTN
jgi:hypothetical protein